MFPRAGGTHERGRRSGGGAKRSWLLLGSSFSHTRLWTAVPLAVLGTSEPKMCRGQAGPPGKEQVGAVGANSRARTHRPSPLLHVAHTWRGSRRSSEASRGNHRPRERFLRSSPNRRAKVACQQRRQTPSRLFVRLARLASVHIVASSSSSPHRNPPALGGVLHRPAGLS
ncbi:hypothetical protein B0J18DRAFT_108583 [Chaetomium sp. MPI-SDFR-AT-0129]|nr:hypothetical protein B0J18DRAFT_108583 [Chaetomium sp. MPI-SDFR-AT-0129]